MNTHKKGKIWHVQNFPNENAHVPFFVFGMGVKTKKEENKWCRTVLSFTSLSRIITHTYTQNGKRTMQVHMNLTMKIHSRYSELHQYFLTRSPIGVNSLSFFL